MIFFIQFDFKECFFNVSNKGILVGFEIMNNGVDE